MYGKCHSASAAACGGAMHSKFQEARNKFGGSFRRPKYNVPTNVVRTEDGFEVHIFAVGFEKQDIEVSVNGDTLTVSGTRTLADDYQPDFVRQEYPIKSFERVFQISDTIDVENIAAKQENGVLIITLPLKPDAKPNKQKVSVQ